MTVQQNEYSEETVPLLNDLERAQSQKNTGSECLGLMLTALSAILFAVMSVLVKFAGDDFNTAQIVFVRSVIQLSLALVSCYFYQVSPLGPSNVNRLLLIARGTSGAFSLGCYFFTLVNMPLGDGTSIFFMGPAFTSVAAYLVLGEPFMLLDIVSVVSCLTGVVLVTRPEFLFGVSDIVSPIHYTVPMWMPALAAFAGACSSAFAYIIVRIVGKKVNFMVHVAYFGGMSTIISGIILYGFCSPIPISEWTFEQTVVLLSVGFLAFLAQCSLNKGLQLANAGPATLMRNLDIVCAFIFGIVLFGEIPQITSIIGALLIGGATAIVAFVKYLKSR
ncbi:hypothetical protein BC833DRAFT_621805 [Globomyces pollinis-pini]|nr:hypothetical protein BC833DRAFT_621805 [Globomyces pollinis-pini]